MQFDIITIFPNIFESYFSESILKRAQAKKLVKIKVHNLRDYAVDKHKSTDDKPYGGGPGMVMMVEPIYRAVKKIKKSQKAKVILLSAKGKKFDQQKAKSFSKLDQLILICGRYEGVDERVAKHIADEEISIGQYILSGGEIGAMALVEATSRLVPGVLGKKESLKEESFSKNISLEYPQYSRPEIFNKWQVPKVLISGDHQKIKQWKEKHSKGLK